MINNLDLFSLHNLALLSDWLEETGELYVDIYMPHSAGSSEAFLVRSMSDLKSLVIQQRWPELVFTIFRRLQYPLRGIANEQLLEQALEVIPEGQSWGIMPLRYYPANCVPNSGYTSHLEFRREFAEVLGETVGVGLEPLCLYAGNCDPNEVFEVALLRKNDFRVAKNQDGYERYVQEPERYRWLESMWQD